MTNLFSNNFIYLASPYTHADPDIREVRAAEAARAAGFLLALGLSVYSPISAFYQVESHLPHKTDFSYWKFLDEKILGISDRLILFLMNGWSQSVGMKKELEFFITKKGIKADHTIYTLTTSGKGYLLELADLNVLKEVFDEIRSG